MTNGSARLDERVKIERECHPLHSLPVSHDDSHDDSVPVQVKCRIFLMPQTSGRWTVASTCLLPIMVGAVTNRRFGDLQFRVLIIGTANAGKTTILQRVCNTTESAHIYRNGTNIVCI
jgi:hypothetical protein